MAIRQWTNLRKWSKAPQATGDFNLITKFTDLGTMDGRKSILGIVITITQDDVGTATHTPLYRFVVRYRLSPNHRFAPLAEIFVTNNDSFNSDGIRQYRKTFLTPIRNVNNFQLQLHGWTDGDLGINDIAIIYRKYRDTAESDLDEE